MRKIKAAQITKTVADLYSNISFNLPSDVKSALKQARKNEKNSTAKEALDVLIENAGIAAKESIPICQDTGLAIVFAEVGQGVQIVGGDFEMAINAGIRKAVKDSYLRASVVKSPIDRINTADNTPAIIHSRIISGDKIRLTILAKGAGAENMSAIKMLKPADGVEGIKQFVMDTVKNAGPNPCPPIIVGVGIGGNLERSAMLAKQALIRNIGSHNKDKKTAVLEKDLLQEINKLGIGPSGLGGKTTCLCVNIETFPCHIASLPVAVNIECHAHRHGTKVI